MARNRPKAPLPRHGSAPAGSTAGRGCGPEGSAPVNHTRDAAAIAADVATSARMLARATAAAEEWPGLREPADVHAVLSALGLAGATWSRSPASWLDSFSSSWIPVGPRCTAATPATPPPRGPRYPTGWSRPGSWPDSSPALSKTPKASWPLSARPVRNKASSSTG